MLKEYALAIAEEGPRFALDQVPQRTEFLRHARSWRSARGGGAVTATGTLFAACQSALEQDPERRPKGTPLIDVFAGLDDIAVINVPRREFSQATGETARRAANKRQ